MKKKSRYGRRKKTKKCGYAKCKHCETVIFFARQWNTDKLMPIAPSTLTAAEKHEFSNGYLVHFNPVHHRSHFDDCPESKGEREVEVPVPYIDN